MDKEVIKIEKYKSAINKIQTLIDLLSNVKVPNGSNHGKHTNLSHRLKNVQKVYRDVIKNKRLTQENIYFLNYVWMLYEDEREKVCE